MALIICPDCGKEISDKSTACIYCGCPISHIDENGIDLDLIKPRCPKCNSTSITTGARGVNGFWGFIGASKTVNRCGNCGYTWKP